MRAPVVIPWLAAPVSLHVFDEDISDELVDEIVAAAQAESGNGCHRRLDTLGRLGPTVRSVLCLAKQLLS